MSDRKSLLTAAANADWQQVMGNGGPPCFYLEGQQFCLRAQRWDGHGPGDYPFHPFVSLADLLHRLPCTCAPECPPSCKGECGCAVCREAYGEFLGSRDD